MDSPTTEAPTAQSEAKKAKERTTEAVNGQRTVTTARDTDARKVRMTPSRLDEASQGPNESHFQFEHGLITDQAAKRWRLRYVLSNRHRTFTARAIRHHDQIQLSQTCLQIASPRRRVNGVFHADKVPSLPVAARAFHENRDRCCGPALELVLYVPVVSCRISEFQSRRDTSSRAMLDHAVFIAAPRSIAKAWVMVLRSLGWDAHEATVFKYDICSSAGAKRKYFDPTKDVLVLCCTSDTRRDLRPFWSYVRYLRDTRESDGIRMLIMTCVTEPFSQTATLGDLNALFNSTPRVIYLPWGLSRVVEALLSVDGLRVRFGSNGDSTCNAT